MNLRYLNNSDYLSLATSEIMSELTDNDERRYIQAESAAESCFIDYLSDNYEIEKEINKGKYIAKYDRSILFPTGVYLYFNDELYQVIRSINSYKTPIKSPYWEIFVPASNKEIQASQFSQFSTYQKDDIVFFNEDMYRCLHPCGFNFKNIQLPGLKAWEEVNVDEWVPIEYALWSVVRYNGSFYTLMNLDDFDNNLPPDSSSNWGEIADYDPEYNAYELSDHEYVVFQDSVFYPIMNVNSDTPEEHVNIIKSDPRNPNIVKYMVRIAMYELTKRIAPNNVSTVRINDYNEAIKWLKDAGKIMLNPRIPRKLDAKNQEILEWQLAEYRVSANPFDNDWIL